MSGWKRENGVFVLVLARFRWLEGVRILTICDVFPSLRFKRHPEGICLRFLRFLAPFGLPLEGNFMTFFSFFEHVKKSLIFERCWVGRRWVGGTGRRPQFPFGKGWDLARRPPYDAYGRPRPGAAYIKGLRPLPPDPNPRLSCFLACHFFDTKA